MSGIARTVVSCLVLVAVVLGLFVYSMTRPPVLSTEQLENLGVFVLPRPREIAEFQLTTQSGKPFGVEQLEGHWSFLFFGFTNCPDVCPTSLAVMGDAVREIVAGGQAADAPFQGIMVSVDPERDDPESLGRYVTAFSKDFIGLSGSQEAIAGFATQLNVAFAKMPDGRGGYQVDHTANIVIVNPRGHYHGFIRLPHKTEAVVAAYRSLAASF